MTTDPRDAIGAPIEDLDTPCLLLDWPASQRNIDKMAAFFADRPAKLRPHFKNHKCVTLARKQLAAGSCVGLTCAKVGEAQVLVEHGVVDDILIANQVMGRRKHLRLVEVAKKARVSIAIDHERQVHETAEAAAAGGVDIGIFVEVDNGMGRCGVQPGEPALKLAQLINGLNNVTFRGIQSYEGHIVYEIDRERRTAETLKSFDKVVDTRRMIEKSGIEVQAVSGGASGTYDITGRVEGVDEIQAGTYATMDWRYHQVVPEFEIAMTILTTVISKPAPERAVLDMGVKGAGAEFGLPRIKDHPDIEVPFFLAEEHTALQNTPDWQVGEVVHFVPSHSCTTCNLHRWIHVHEDGKVVDVWPIEASGRLT